MSLLITSSRQEQFHKLGGAESELGIENPAQYRNTLRSPLQIKADSEVAVQSIKCVRESGVFTVTDDMNCRFLIIFGNELSAVGETITPNCPVAVSIPSGIYSAHQFAKTIELEVSDSLKKAYPNITSIIVDRNFATGGGGSIFDGFIYTYENASAVANSILAGSTVQGAIDGDNFEALENDSESWFSFQGYEGEQVRTDGFKTAFTANEVVVTASHTAGTNAGRRTVAIVPDHPLSETGGSCVFNITAPGSATSDPYSWCVGLTRGFDKDQIPIPGNDEINFINDGLDNTLKKLAGGDDIELSMWWDYCVYFDKEAAAANPSSALDSPLGALKVIQSGVTCDYYRGNVMGNIMTAVANSTLENVSSYNNSNLTDGTFVGVKFVRTGTAISIVLTDNKGVDKVINANGSLNPVTLSTNMLYPKLYIGTDGKSLSFKSFSKGANTDTRAAYGTENHYGLDVGWKAELDSIYDTQARCMDSITNIGDGFLTAATDTRYTNSTLNGSGIASNSKFIMLFGKTHYTVFIDEVADTLVSRDASQIFGFSVPTINQSDFAVNASSILNAKVVFKSTEVPNAFSTKNMFIRFNSVQAGSMNANKGSISKILYGIPTFDNSGRSEGPLYFEPAERVYLDCSNTEPFNLTDVSVDIVDVNEQVISGLTGQTTVCFHFREKAK